MRSLLCPSGFVLLWVLPFLAVVVDTQTCRRLILSLVADAGDGQHDDGDQVREHLEELCHAHGEAQPLEGRNGGDIGACQEKSTEEG